jgi:hypothetical protein
MITPLFLLLFLPLLCHPERSAKRAVEGPAFVLAFLSVIPEGNLLFATARSPTTLSF